MGYYVENEVSTSKGRIDSVIFSKENIYVLEFKINNSAESAISQIKEKQYYKKYLDRNKPIFLVGIALKNKEIENLLVEKLEVQSL